MSYYPLANREQQEQRRRFWGVRSTIFAVAEVILALCFLILGVVFNLPALALMLGIAGTLALMALYMMRPIANR